MYYNKCKISKKSKVGNQLLIVKKKCNLINLNLTGTILASMFIYVIINTQYNTISKII